MPTSLRVGFTNVEPSEFEFFEEYDKYNKLNFWFVLIYILRCTSPFSSGFQTAASEDHDTAHKLLNHFDEENRRLTQDDIYLSMFNCTDNDKNIRAMKIQKQLYSHCMIDNVLTSLRIFRYVGSSIGSIIGGILADIFGRRIIGLGSSVIWSISSCVLIFLSTVKALQIGFLMHSVLCAATDVITFVNLVEIANKGNRFLVVYTQASYILGKIMRAVASDYITIWKLLLISAASLNGMVLFSVWYMPESPKWLINKNRKAEAMKQLEEIDGCSYNFTLSRSRGQESNCKVFCHMLLYLKGKKLLKFLVFILLMIICTIFTAAAKWRMNFRYLNAKNFHLIVFTVEVASFLFITPIYVCLGQRLGLCVIFILLTIQTVIGLFTNAKAEIFYNIFAILFGSAGINFLWIYVMHVFPTFLRATVLGCLYGAYSMAVAGASIIMTIDKDYDKRIYYSCFMIGSLLGMIVLTLPHTGREDLPNSKLFQ